MFGMFTKFLNVFSTGNTSSFLSASFIWTGILNVINIVWNFILSILWIVIKFVLGIMEAFEYIVMEFLGVGSTMTDYLDFADSIDLRGDIILDPENGISFFDTTAKVFRAVAGVALLLMIIFTVIAIVRQEVSDASAGFGKPSKGSDGKDKSVPGNDKKEIISKLFRNIVAIVVLPVAMIAIIAGVNSVLTAFSNALNVNTGVTVAGQILAQSTYDANKYRTYANANQRVPIIIKAYNDTDVKPDQYSSLVYEIKNKNTQKKLKETAVDLVENTFLSFKSAATYKNNKFYNSSYYADYYEQFVCTSEQYQIMADFIDYAQKYAINYYIKSTSETDIEWKYVNDAVYEANTNTLTISYSDATNDYDNNKNTKSYTMTFTPTEEVTSPISDALDSIMAMLGVGEYGDNVYKVMERDDSGNFLNLVQWANEKAIIKLTQDVANENNKITIDVNTLGLTDQIIVYEYFHFSSNNTLGAYSLDQLYSKGAELDVYQIVYRDYYTEPSDLLSPEKYVYCVEINNNYYEVEENLAVTDSFGNPYYTLKEIDLESQKFMERGFTILKSTGTTTVKLSDNFNINKAREFDANGNNTITGTGSWSLVDQIMVYEYYKDLSIANDLSQYSFAQIKSGIPLPTYQITTSSDGTSSSAKNYVLINGTYYPLDTMTSPNAAGTFLISPKNASKTTYGYELIMSYTDLSTEKNGFDDDNNDIADYNFLTTTTTAGNLVYETTQSVVTEGVTIDEKFNTYKLQLSEKFDATDVSTWSYKDYFVFYLYCNHGVASNVEELKTIGVEGVIGKLDGKTYLQSKKDNSTTNNVLINLEQAINISELNISNKLDVTDTIHSNALDTNENNLFITFDKAEDSAYDPDDPNYDLTADVIMSKEIGALRFDFSESFDESNISEWTISDFILSYFSTKGVINPLDDLKSNGYTSLIYKITNGKLYKFGTKHISTATDKTYYLSEYNVLNNLKDINGNKIEYNDLTSWLNESLYKFICKYNGLKDSDIFNTHEQILENIFAEYEDKILDLSSFASQMVGSYWGDQANSVEVFTYKNPSFALTNLASWTKFDYILYALLGKASGMYSSQIIEHDSKKYVIVGDKAINISEGTFQMNITSETLTLTSATNSFDNKTKLNEFYPTLIKGDDSGLSYVTSKKVQYTTEGFAYSTYVNGSVNLIDLVLARTLGTDIAADQVYKFSILTDGIYKYLKINDVYVRVHVKQSGLETDVSYDVNEVGHYESSGEASTLTMVDSTSYFTSAGSNYSAFETTLTNYKQIDSVIYNITESISPKNYAKYTYDSKNYIAVENGPTVSIIDVTDETLLVSSGAGDYAAADESKAKNLIQFVCDKYYSMYYSESVSNLVVDAGTGYSYTFHTSFTLTSPKTWSPLEIILYQLFKDVEPTVTIQELYRSQNTSRKYMKIMGSVDGVIKYYYIDYTDFLNSSTSGTTITLTEKADVTAQAVLRAAFVRNVSDTAADLSQSAFESQSLSNALFNTASISITSQSLTNLTTTHAISADVDDPTSWTWFDILYYNLYGKFRDISSTQFYEFYTSDGTFTAISYDGDMYYYNKTANGGLFTAFEVGSPDATKSVTYNENNIDPLAMMAYKLTGLPTNTLNIFKFVDNAGNPHSFYYVQSNNDFEYYAIFEITTTSSALGVLKTSGDYDEYDESQIANYKLFTYKGKTYNELSSWTLLDFIIAKANGSVSDKYYASYIYKYGGQRYFLVGDVYININKLVDDGFETLIGIDSASTNYGYIKYTEIHSGTTYEIEGVGNIGLQIASVSNPRQGFDDVVNATGTNTTTIVKYSNLDATDQGLIGTIDSSNPTNYDASENYKIFKFSQYYDANNFKSWTLADLILYYVFSAGYYETTPGSHIYNTETKDFDGDGDTESFTYSLSNFQYAINNGGMIGQICYILKTDEYGDSVVYKAINFTNKTFSPQELYFDYDVFMSLYEKYMVYYTTDETNLISQSFLDADITPGVTSVIVPDDDTYYHLTYDLTINSNESSIDFTYNNFYFFKTSGDVVKKFNLKRNVSTSFIEKIVDGDAQSAGVINLKLSNGFVLSNQSTWTLLDYIIIYEFSRSSLSLDHSQTGPNTNLFYDMEFSELKEGVGVDVYVNLYTDGSDEGIKVIAVNGNYYNINDYIRNANPSTVQFVKDLSEVFDEFSDKYKKENIANIKNNLNMSYQTGAETPESDYANIISLSAYLIKWFTDYDIGFYASEQDKSLAKHIKSNISSLQKTEYTFDGTVYRADLSDYAYDAATPNKIYQDNIKEFLEGFIEILQGYVDLPQANKIEDDATFALTFLYNVSNYYQANADDDMLQKPPKILYDESNAILFIDNVNNIGTCLNIATDRIYQSEFSKVMSDTLTSYADLLDSSKTYKIKTSAMVNSVAGESTSTFYNILNNYFTSKAGSNESFVETSSSLFSSYLLSQINSSSGTLLKYIKNYKYYETDEDPYIKADDVIASPTESTNLFYKLKHVCLEFIKETETSSDQNLYNSNDVAIARNIAVLIAKTDYLNVTTGSIIKALRDDVCKPLTTTTVISNGAVNNYDFKLLYNKVDYALIPNYALRYTISQDSKTVSYETNNGRCYKTLNKNLGPVIPISFANYGTYTLSPYIKEVGWPQKLMTDMQVLYPDLNWGTLIATEGWLDTLGEFTSAYTNGRFESSGNSSNTTAAGLVLSEFFVSVAKKVTGAYGDFEYESLFDEDVIKSLMLSLLGEYEYETLSLQAEIFMEMFNTSFAPILDDIAYEQSINIVDGQVDNFVMCVYKSYLATLLLSSDIGEYLYTVATRVYAQYTIYEALACASGDYASYYSFVNQQPDENGEIVDSFIYSTFYDLVLYENLLIGNSTPTYTFNMFNVYRYYEEQSDPNITLSQVKTKFADATDTESKKKALAKKLFGQLDTLYDKTYKKGERIEDTSPLYCYMLEAYWAIFYECEVNLFGVRQVPKYLEYYRTYLDDDISRWGLIDYLSTADSTRYIPKLGNYETSLMMSKMLMIVKLVSLWAIDGYSNVDTSDMSAFESFMEKLKNMDSFEINTPKSILNKSFSAQIKDKLNTAFIGVLDMYSLVKDSEGTTKNNPIDAWNKIKDVYEALPYVIDEVRAIIALDYSEDEVTENGSRIGKDSDGKLYVDQIYEDILDKLNGFYDYLSAYIDAQSMIDTLTKTSITYTLAQYGHNYVSSGFNFNVENRNYSFNSTLSSERLAEYVYGGAYLENFGISPIYTDSDFEGIIKQTRVYDSVSGSMKIKLEMWPQLRTLASKLADYTAKLYYTTNLPNLAKNVSDGIYLTDYVKDSSNYQTTQEYLILLHLIDNESISLETLSRLIVANGTAISDKNDLKEYLDDVWDSNTFDTYYNQTNANDRIHAIFKNVISYLIVSEGESESNAENAVKLDNITFKELKLTLMEKLVDYEQNPSETTEENSKRYLTLFNLISGEFNYKVDTLNITKTNVTPYYAVKGGGSVMYKNVSGGSDYSMKVSFEVDRSTRNNILKLSGLANRPLEELVNLEYNELYNRNGNYDEAIGDVFVVCTYDDLNGKYIPVLARNSDIDRDDCAGGIGGPTYKYSSYIGDTGIDLESNYYAEENYAYPIIAKGIVTATGLPTAIKKVDGELVYYRTNLVPAGNVDESAVAATATVSEVNTVGYTKYVESSSHKQVSGTNKKTMFVGSFDLKNYVNTKSDVYYMQDLLEYKIAPSDDYGGINVLDQFSSFYLLGGQTYFLLLLGLSTMMPLLFSASLSAFRRILDLIFLVISGPVIIAMRSLEPDKNGKGIGKTAYDNWFNQVKSSLLAAFGYIIGFNLYYILTQTVMGLSFVTDTTMAKIKALGGLSFITKDLLNSILKYVYIVGAASVVKSGASMLTTFIDSNITNPFGSQIDPDKQEPLTAVMSTVNELKDGIEKVANLADSIVTGQILIDAKNAAVEAAKNAMPGGAIISNGVELAQNLNTKRKSNLIKKAAMKAAEANGTPKSEARKAAKQAAKAFYDEEVNERNKAKAERLKSANRFLDTVMFQNTPKMDERNKAKGIKSKEKPVRFKKDEHLMDPLKEEAEQRRAEREKKKGKRGEKKGKGKKGKKK